MGCNCYLFHNIIYKDICDKLSQFPEVKWLSVTTGQYDVFCWVALSTPSDLGSFLRDKLGVISGVQSSETFVSLGGTVKNGNGEK